MRTVNLSYQKLLNPQTSLMELNPQTHLKEMRNLWIHLLFRFLIHIIHNISSIPSWILIIPQCSQHCPRQYIFYIDQSASQFQSSRVSNVQITYPNLYFVYCHFYWKLTFTISMPVCFCSSVWNSTVCEFIH